MRFSCDQCSRFLRRGFVKSAIRPSPMSARPRPRSTLTAIESLIRATVFGARTEQAAGGHGLERGGVRVREGRRVVAGSRRGRRRRCVEGEDGGRERERQRRREGLVDRLAVDPAADVHRGLERPVVALAGIPGVDRDLLDEGAERVQVDRAGGVRDIALELHGLLEHVPPIPARGGRREDRVQADRPGDVMAQLRDEAVAEADLERLEGGQEDGLAGGHLAVGVRGLGPVERARVGERAGLIVGPLRGDHVRVRRREADEQRKQPGREGDRGDDVLGRATRTAELGEAADLQHGRPPVRGAATAATAARGRRGSTEQQHEHRAAREEAGVCGLPDPAEPAADLRHVQPELAEDLAASGVARVDEIVVVALEVVARPLDDDDAMQHRTVQHRALVEGDVSDPVGAGGTDEGEVALVEHRLHARADGRGVRRGSPELGWCDPDERRDDQAGSQEGEPEWSSRAHLCMTLSQCFLSRLTTGPRRR